MSILVITQEKYLGLLIDGEEFMITFDKIDTLKVEKVEMKNCSVVDFFTLNETDVIHFRDFSCGKVKSLNPTLSRTIKSRMMKTFSKNFHTK